MLVKKIISIIICVFVVNLIVFSIGFGQTNINVQGVVPETEFNKNIKSTTLPIQSVKENKYQYFFEKSLLLKEESANENQTIYDRLASYGLMAVLMFIAALLMTIILRMFDYYKLKK